MMERLVQTRGDAVTVGLQVQYRMHEQIMRFPSTRFYDNRLSAHESVASHMLTDLSPGLCTMFPEAPITFVDTAGASWDEAIDPEGESKFNPKEGQWILERVEGLVEEGIPPDAIAVIAPYSAQVRWLRDRCRYRDVEIDTVDGFQGREKEAVLITLVRSNDIGEIGFLGDERRMNVAMTRAKRKLIMIGDGATLARHEFYASLIAYFESIGAYHSVWEWSG
jgi:superfamily I DNA and/or RNA helicase